MTEVTTAQAQSLLLHRMTKQPVDPFVVLRQLYGDHNDYRSWERRVRELLVRAICQRPAELRELDSAREVQPDWFQHQSMIGYKTYIDRFAGDFKGVAEKIPHLKTLSTRYLHLLGVLKCREGLSDGGFAISDYRATNPAFGSIDDLSALASTLRQNDICLSIDFVFNHTSDDHPWAQQAAAGDPRYKEYYFCYPDRSQPDLIEPYLGEVFPVSSPGNFVYNEQGDFWVWSTFHSFQWDLNYRNPEVFLDILGALLFLANKGVDIFRMDATAFLWKEPGTDCKNHPNTHEILKAFRWLLALTAPGCLLKAEAITRARDVKKYFGGKKSGFADEAQLSYHAPLMCGLWASLATQNTRKLSAMVTDLGPRPRQSSWITYLRCHDDIGWRSLTDEHTPSWSMSEQELAFLDQFYAGEVADSFAIGHSFQQDGNQSAMATNGTAASLAGLEQALQHGDEAEINTSVDRLLLLYASMYAFSGLPTLFMGEEVGLLNDNDYTSYDFVDDSRYLHRPFFDWDLLREIEKTHPLARLRQSIELIARTRASLPVMHAENQEAMILTPASEVLAFQRRNAFQRFVFVGNFSDRDVTFDSAVISDAFARGAVTDALAGSEFSLSDTLRLKPYQYHWLSQH